MRVWLTPLLTTKPHTISLYFFPIMSTMFTINNKQISHKDLNIVRDFFTDDQWDLIDYALSEYQDHDDSTEKCKETLNVIGDLFRSSY